jgi:hypothetical protein
MLVVLILDISPYSVVRPTKISFRFELKISNQAGLRTPNVAMISKLVFHLAEEDASRIHVGLCHKAVQVSIRNLQADIPIYNRSPVFKNLMTAIPSIILAAEFPRNLLLGFSVPSIRM